jgi:hypothetical protein
LASTRPAGPWHTAEMILPAGNSSEPGANQLGSVAVDKHKTR